MCGRFDQDRSNAEIDALVRRLEEKGREIPRLGEIFPTAPALVMVPPEEPAVMVWGLPRRDGKGVIFNVRSESALTRPFFRQAMEENPLVVPATGFYEWRGEKGHKQKFCFQATPGHGLLYLAGFWRRCEEGCRFTVLTRSANAFMAPYHHRMPVLLDPKECDLWLRRCSKPELLQSPPLDLVVEPPAEARLL